MSFRRFFHPLGECTPSDIYHLYHGCKVFTAAVVTICIYLPDCDQDKIAVVSVPDNVIRICCELSDECTTRAMYRIVYTYALIVKSEKFDKHAK